MRAVAQLSRCPDFIGNRNPDIAKGNRQELACPSP